MSRKITRFDSRLIDNGASKHTLYTFIWKLSKDGGTEMRLQLNTQNVARSQSAQTDYSRLHWSVSIKMSTLGQFAFASALFPSG